MALRIMFDRGTATATPHARQLATLPESLAGNLGQSDLALRRLAAERALDEVLAESFPASDPPSWTLGVVRPPPVQRAPYDGVREQTVTRAPRPQPAAGGVLDVSGDRRVERTFIDGLISLAAATGLVLLVPFAVLLVGVPIALLVRGLLEALGWLFSFVSP